MKLDFFQNASLLQETDGDYFDQVYGQGPLFIFVLLAWYIYGIINCCLLAFVAHFERSGEAGHYRTVVNQLVSQDLAQVGLHQPPSNF